jgi:hypothetical protein
MHSTCPAHPNNTRCTVAYLSRNSSLWNFSLFVSFFLHFSPRIWNVSAVPNCVNLSSLSNHLFLSLHSKVCLNCVYEPSTKQQQQQQQQHTLHDDLQSHCMHVEVIVAVQNLWTRTARTFCAQCTSPVHLAAFGTIQQQEYRHTRPRAGQQSLFVSPCSSPLKLLPHIPGAPNCRHPSGPLTPRANLCYQHYCSLPAPPGT